jgi:hypothetical protein
MVTDGELHTIICEVEAVLNNRPLTYQEDAEDPRSVEPLTPSHLLHGRVLQQLPYIRFQAADDLGSDGVDDVRDRVAYRGALMEHFWQRWCHEYLATIRERAQKTVRKASSDVPHVGDVVLVYDKTPRSSWSLGRVTELMPGEDGEVRAVKLVSRGSTLTRAVYKLYPLELAGDAVIAPDNEHVPIHPTVEKNGSIDDEDSPEDPTTTTPQPKRERRAAFNRATSWLKTITKDISGGGSMS